MASHLVTIAQIASSFLATHQSTITVVSAGIITASVVLPIIGATVCSVFNCVRKTVRTVINVGKIADHIYEENLGKITKKEEDSDDEKEEEEPEKKEEKIVVVSRIEKPNPQPRTVIGFDMSFERPGMYPPPTFPQTSSCSSSDNRVFF